MSMVRVLSSATDLDLLVFQRDVLVGAGLVALDLLVLLDGLAGLGIDIAALDPVAGGPVQGVEANLLAFGDAPAIIATGQVTSESFR